MAVPTATGDPASTEAYSGAWVRDVQSGTLTATDANAANNTPGVILIRRPPLPGKMGHIAVADGAGGTVEAAGVGLGVRLTLKEPLETGPVVKRVQATLNHKGINAGKVDGIYGPLTVAAVAAFQQMNRPQRSRNTLPTVSRS